MAINKVLNEIEYCLEKFNIQTLSLLYKGIIDIELDEFIRENYELIEMNIPDLYSLYSWHNGTKVKNNSIKPYLFDDFSFCSLDYIQEILNFDNFYKFKEKKLFPFFTSYNGEYLALSLHNDQQIFYCSTWDIEIENIVSRYDSIFSMLKTAIEQYNNNCFISEDDGFLSLNFDNYKTYLSIGNRLNPRSKYWKIKIGSD